MYFQPLKYFFDGAEKKAPDDQQGFIYQGTTYVPLRFVSEALGKQVGYDGPTTSIYVGKPKEGTVTYMQEMKTITSDMDGLGTDSKFITNTGDTFLNSYYIGDYHSRLTNEYILNGNYKSFDAFLAPHSAWSKLPKENSLGELKIYADDKLVYSSGGIASDISRPINVHVDLTGVLKVKIEFKSNAGSVGLLEPKFTQ